jgi:hypothetical protein
MSDSGIASPESGAAGSVPDAGADTGGGTAVPVPEASAGGEDGSITDSSLGDATGDGASGTLFCVYKIDASGGTCHAFEGFVDADAYAEGVAACEDPGWTIVSSCPPSPTGCCVANAGTPHAAYQCYYGEPDSGVVILMDSCTTGWLMNPTPDQLPY